MHLHPKKTQRLSGTERLEAFSDGVFAIIITLLILDVKVPHLADASAAAVMQGIRDVLPQLLSFAFSFVAVCIFWVNHYYFYRQITHIDWPMLWHNCALLFFVSIVPFTTAFISAYPTVSMVLSLYSFIMFLAALSFNLMMRHAFFHSDLADSAIAMKVRHRRTNRGMIAVIGHLLGALLAPLSVWATWTMLVVVPLYFFVPRVLEGSETFQD